MNPFDINGENKRSILIIDNYGIYSDPSLLVAYRAIGIIVEYLLPYSPDFNPIKLSFSILKV